MPELTPDSEATIHISETGLQIALEAYQRARPEELRIVSSNYPDGDPGIAPINLNDDGDWLDYALRIEKIAIDMAPADPALQSPIPPADGQFQIACEISVEFRNFTDASAVFGFPLKVWARCNPYLVDEGTAVFVALRLDELRIKDLGPDVLLDYLQYIMTLVVDHAISRVRIPTTLNLGEFFTFNVLDAPGVKLDTTQLYGAILRASAVGGEGLR